MTVSTKDTLSADHQELGRLLDQVFAVLNRRDWRGSFAALDLFWARLAMHIRAEHLHLFPALVPSASNSVKDMIRQLRTDHTWFMEELASLIKLSRLTTHEPDTWREPAEMRERIETLRGRLAAHDELEETAIYPLVEQFLDPADVVTLNTEIQKELEEFPPRFSDRGSYDI